MFRNALHRLEVADDVKEPLLFGGHLGLGVVSQVLDSDGPLKGEDH